MAIEVIRNLLQKKVEDDARAAIFEFQLSGLGKLGLLAPHPIFWMQLGLVMAMQSIINTIAAVLAYFLILKPRGSMSSYLFAYGILFPLLVYLPLRLTTDLGVHSTCILSAQAGSLSIVFFRCMMAAHATLPHYVEKDLLTFVLFFVSPVQFVFDPKTGRVMSASAQDISSSIFKSLKAISMIAILLGVLKQNDYDLFGRREVQNFLDLFRWRNLCNNYAMAYMTGLGLECGARIVGTCIECITGMKVIELSENPLTHSTSPSDFWGRRWNTLVHLVLKGGIYAPLRNSGFSKQSAALMTFAGSGLLHEYILTVMGVMMKDHVSSDPKYGYHLAFFAWNGVVLTLEGIFRGHPLFQEMKKVLPAPIITALVLMTVLPVGHWFTDEYAKAGFYDDFAVGMPLVVWTPFRHSA